MFGSKRDRTLLSGLSWVWPRKGWPKTRKKAPLTMRMPPRGKGQRKPMTGQAVHKEHQEKTNKWGDVPADTTRASTMHQKGTADTSNHPMMQGSRPKKSKQLPQTKYKAPERNSWHQQSFNDARKPKTFKQTPQEQVRCPRREHLTPAVIQWCKEADNHDIQADTEQVPDISGSTNAIPTVDPLTMLITLVQCDSRLYVCLL